MYPPTNNFRDARRRGISIHSAAYDDGMDENYRNPYDDEVERDEFIEYNQGYTHGLTDRGPA